MFLRDDVDSQIYHQFTYTHNIEMYVYSFWSPMLVILDINILVIKSEFFKARVFFKFSKIL